MGWLCSPTSYLIYLNLGSDLLSYARLAIISLGRGDEGFKGAYPSFARLPSSPNPFFLVELEVYEHVLSHR